MWISIQRSPGTPIDNIGLHIGPPHRSLGIPRNFLGIFGYMGPYGPGPGGRAGGRSGGLRFLKWPRPQMAPFSCFQVYVFELAIRMTAYGKHFFRPPDNLWNCFDSLLVAQCVFEEFCYWAEANIASPGTDCYLRQGDGDTKTARCGSRTCFLR